jgi:uncharacterized protein (TIGR00645 family)
LQTASAVEIYWALVSFANRTLWNAFLKMPCTPPAGYWLPSILAFRWHLSLTIKFFQEIWRSAEHFSIAEADLILVLLSLVDMTLVGGLLVMVMFSGYENFVSQLDIDERKEKLSWLGKMDASSLKNKVAASIVAISSIHLARVYGREECPG